MEPSEVLRTVLDSGVYLSGENPMRTNYMCCVISSSLYIEGEDRNKTINEIHKVLNHYLFLRPMLRDRGLIPFDTPYGSDVYKEAAIKFWEDLIKKLKEHNQ